MKRKFIIFLVFIICFSIISCQSNQKYEDRAQTEADSLEQAFISSIEDEMEEIDTEKEENDSSTILLDSVEF
jgi:Na+/H+ antiporter NhaC